MFQVLERLSSVKSNTIGSDVLDVLYALTPRLLSHFTHLYNIFLTKPSFSMNGNSRNPIQFLKPTTNSGKLLFSIRVKSNGKPHYNPSARIIDPVSHTTYVGVNFIHNPIQFLKPTTNSGKLLFSIRVKSNGKPHYNPSARIIDPVSHTTYVGVNFIHKWLDLQFKANSERQTF